MGQCSKGDGHDVLNNGTSLLPPPRPSFGERFLRKLLFIGPDTHKEDLGNTARIINSQIGSDMTLARHNEALELHRRSILEDAELRQRRGG